MRPPIWHRLLKDYQQAEVRLHPTEATSRGDFRYLGRYEDNLTPAYLAECRRLNAEETARLKAIDRSTLGAQDQLSYDILGWTLADDADGLQNRASAENPRRNCSAEPVQWRPYRLCARNAVAGRISL